MIKVVGVRFRKAGKVYYFDPDSFEMSMGQGVVVETVRGIEYGTVVLEPKEIEEDDVVSPLKKVIRLATEEDTRTELENKVREREAFDQCKKKIIKHGLEMKLIDCEYTFDNNKLLFYFTAEGRIDFRDLVKDLASVFKTRIELRQIGVRDETKLIGSIGICGRALCCHAHLTDFHPVSIKMAKDQNLSLNPTKISGVCGRLMCCLKYEEETYQELNKSMPRVGDKVMFLETGAEAEVIHINVIRQLVKVVIRKADGDNEITEVKVDQLVVPKGSKRKGKAAITKEELEELRKLELLEKEELEGPSPKKPSDRKQGGGKGNQPKKPSQQDTSGASRKQGRGDDRKQERVQVDPSLNQEDQAPKASSEPGGGQADQADGQEAKGGGNKNRNRRKRPKKSPAAKGEGQPDQVQKPNGPKNPPKGEARPKPEGPKKPQEASDNEGKAKSQNRRKRRRKPGQDKGPGNKPEGGNS